MYDSKSSFLRLFHVVYSQHMNIARKVTPSSTSVSTEYHAVAYLDYLREYLYSKPVLEETTSMSTSCTDVCYPLCYDAPMDIVTMDYYCRHVKPRVIDWIFAQGKLEESQIRECFSPVVRYFYRQTVNSLVLLLVPWFHMISRATVYEGEETMRGTRSGVDMVLVHPSNDLVKKQLMMYMMDRIMTSLMYLEL